MISPKTPKYYKSILKKYRKKFTDVYERCFRQSDVVGYGAEAGRQWIKTTNDFSFESFFDFYIKNIKTSECFETIGSVLHHMYNNEDLKDECIDYLIAHAIFETYHGVMIEKTVDDYLVKQNDVTKLSYNNEKFDKQYGVDNGFLFKERKYFVQVKPISFFIGEDKHLVNDRKRLFKKFEKLKKENKEYADAILLFCVYDERNDGIYFLKTKNGIFNILDKEKYFSEDVMAFRHDFCYTDNTLWFKMMESFYG